VSLTDGIASLQGPTLRPETPSGLRRGSLDYDELDAGLGGYGENPLLELSSRFAVRLVNPVWANAGL